MTFLSFKKIVGTFSVFVNYLPDCLLLVLDFFLAMNFWHSEHNVEKVYEVYTLSGLSWSVVSIGTCVTSYNWSKKVQFLAFFCKLSGTWNLFK